MFFFSDWKTSVFDTSKQLNAIINLNQSLLLLLLIVHIGEKSMFSVLPSACLQQRCLLPPLGAQVGPAEEPAAFGLPPAELLCGIWIWGHMLLQTPGSSFSQSPQNTGLAHIAVAQESPDSLPYCVEALVVVLL